MEVFIHHIYELKKGLRRLVLYTCPADELPEVEKRLIREKIPYLLSRVSDRKTNVFFGDRICIGVLEQFSTLALNRISNQEDFILGILLGYDLKLQCRRFLERMEDTDSINLNARTA